MLRRDLLAALAGFASLPNISLAGSTDDRPPLKTVQEGLDYYWAPKTLEPNNSLPVEVLYFFSYLSSSCSFLSQRFEQWRKTLSNHAVIRLIPVNERSNRVARRVSYALESMNVLWDIHQKIFIEVHQKLKPAVTEAHFAAIVEKFGVNRHQFLLQLSAMNHRVSDADYLIESFNITDAPSFVVQGKYVTSLALVQHNQDRLFYTLSQLIEYEQAIL